MRARHTAFNSTRNGRIIARVYVSAARTTDLIIVSFHCCAVAGPDMVPGVPCEPPFLANEMAEPPFMKFTVYKAHYFQLLLACRGYELAKK